MKIEKLDVDNIIEIKQIRGLLRTTNRPELLTMFELLCRTANKKINDEIPWAITGSDTISHRDIKNYCNAGEVIRK